MTTLPPDQDIVFKGYDPEISRRLFAFLGPYRWRFSLAMVLMLFSSAAAVAGPYLVKVAIDDGIGAGSIALGSVAGHLGLRGAFGAAAVLSAFAIPYFLWAERRFLLPRAARPQPDS